MDEDEARRVILARRARFVAAAIAGAGAAGVLEACSDSHEDGDGGVADTDPRPCLSPPRPDACLSIRLDTGLPDAGGSDGAALDAPFPMPCLSPPLPIEDAASLEDAPDESDAP